MKTELKKKISGSEDAVQFAAELINTGIYRMKYCILKIKSAEGTVYAIKCRHIHQLKNELEMFCTAVRYMPDMLDEISAEWRQS